MELPVPPEAVYRDKEGHPRRAIRGRWWNDNPVGQTYRSLIFPPAVGTIDLPVSEELAALMPKYTVEAPPIFIGHYWMPADSPLEPLTPQYCLLGLQRRQGRPHGGLPLGWRGRAGA